jgi:hypothetical protein
MCYGAVISYLEAMRLWAMPGLLLLLFRAKAQLGETTVLWLNTKAVSRKNRYLLSGLRQHLVLLPYNSKNIALRKKVVNA